MSGSLERSLAVARRLRAGFVGVNGGAPYGADVPFGGAVFGRPVFMVADEANRVGVRVAGTAVVFGIDAFAIFYGQFLPKTGLQANQEIGNR